jgi:hypothetical protein
LRNLREKFYNLRREAVPYQSSLEMSCLAKVTDLQIMENIGHMGMFEAKEETQQMILNFLLRCIGVGRF